MSSPWLLSETVSMKEDGMTDDLPAAAVVEAELARRRTVNELTEKLTHAMQAIGDFQVYINSLPADRRAVLHDHLGAIVAPIKEAFQVLGTGWLGPVVFMRENLNAARVPGHVHELYCCVGCGGVFSGLAAVNAHQTGRFTAESCKPISRAT